MTLHVLPSLPTPYASNVAGRNAVEGRQIASGFARSANCQHVLHSELRGSRVLSSAVSVAPKPENVRDVFALISPPQMGRVDARWVGTISVKGDVIGRVGALSTVQRHRNVRGVEGAVADRERAVPAVDDSSSPYPATIIRKLSDLCPKEVSPNQGRIGSFHAVNIPQDAICAQDVESCFA